MKRQDLKQLISAKRRGAEPLSEQDATKGFKGWYSSKYLPHFDSPGAQQYITYRLADSLPRERRNEWRTFMELSDPLERHRRLERYLDRGRGGCALRDPRLAKLVQDSLWRYDGIRYRLLAWVVMANHVHVLVEIWQVPLSKVVQAWKGFTGKEASKILTCGGERPFWQEDYFDRFVRDEDHFRRVVRYIEQNPVKAGLVTFAWQWPWSSAHYRQDRGATSVKSLTHNSTRPFQPDSRGAQSLAPGSAAPT